MTEQWGAPLTGAQMRALRAAGLPDGTAYQFKYALNQWANFQAGVNDHNWFEGEELDHRLPANHPAYTLLTAGWLDGAPMYKVAQHDWGWAVFKEGAVASDTFSLSDQAIHNMHQIIAKAGSCPACEPAPCYCELMTKDPNAPEPDATETPVDDHQSGLPSADGRQTATGFLDKAKALLAQRGKDYDSPEGERSMGKTIAAFNAITGRGLEETDGWLLMALLKMVRQETSAGFHADSAKDLIAYAALAAEAGSRDHE